MKSPKRLYSAEHIAAGVGMVGRLQQHVLAVAPTSIGPLSALNAPPSQLASLPEIMEGHCAGCREKKAFQVEGSDQMSNGTLRKYGKGVCGHTVSTFVSAPQKVFASGATQDAGS